MTVDEFMRGIAEGAVSAFAIKTIAPFTWHRRWRGITWESFLKNEWETLDALPEDENYRKGFAVGFCHIMNDDSGSGR